MAFKIIWSRGSLGDLETIGEFISRDSSVYASAMISRLYTAVQSLSQFPQMGRRVPELDNESIRELIVQKYRVIYRVDAESVVIAAVIHGARQLEKALQDRPV